MRIGSDPEEDLFQPPKSRESKITILQSIFDFNILCTNLKTTISVLGIGVGNGVGKIGVGKIRCWEWINFASGKEDINVRQNQNVLTFKLL